MDIEQVEETFTLKRPPIPPLSKEPPEDLVILRTDSLAERARKMQLIKKQNSVERELSRERSLPRSVERYNIYLLLFSTEKFSLVRFRNYSYRGDRNYIKFRKRKINI